jgi:hypothetical protein
MSAGEAGALVVAALGLAAAGSGHGPLVEGPPVDVNASMHPGIQGEVSIAVDPFVPSRLLPLPEGALLHADPMLAFDSRGQAHLAVIPVGPGNRSLGIELMRSSDAEVYVGRARFALAP